MKDNFFGYRNWEKLPPGSIHFYMRKYDLYYMRMTKCASDSIIHWFKCYIEDLISIDKDGVGEFKISLTSIRNPFDRLVSSYKFFMKHHRLHPIMQSNEIEFPKYAKRVIYLGHPEGLTDSAEIKENFYRQKMNPSLDDWEYILRVHTVPLTHSFCDARKFTDIVRFENLQNDWEGFLNKYGILHSPLEHSNKTDEEVYWKYYDRETRDLVAEYYKEDLLTFDYKF